MKKFLLNNIGWKLLSVFIAVLLWLIVLNISDPVDTQTYYNVPVEFINTDLLTSEGKVYEVLDNSNQITVRISAKRSILNGLSKDNIRAEADFTDMTLSNTVAIRLSSTKNNNEIENMSASAEFVRLSVENVSRKQLVIDVITTGTPEDNYVLGDIDIDQNLVRLTGPNSVVSRVAVAQAVVDITGMHETISTSAELKFYDSEGNQVVSDSLTSNISYVNVVASILTSKEIECSYNISGEPAEGYAMTGNNSTTPGKIVVVGPETTLRNLSFIAIPDGIVDVTGATDNVTIEVPLAQYLPSGVRIEEGPSTVIVSVPIEKIETRTLEISEENIVLNNIPDGYEAELAAYDEHNKLKLTGIPSVFALIEADKLEGSIDVGSSFEEANIEAADGVYAMKVEYSNIPDRLIQTEDHLVVVQLKKIDVEGQKQTEGGN